MINMWLSIVFGIVFIAGLFLMAAWARTVFDKRYNHDIKFLLTSTGLVFGTLGVTILSINRVLAAMYDDQLAPWVLALAGTIMAISMALLVRGTAEKAISRICFGFAASSAVWVIFCLWWWVLR